jgi:hypothetical protein
VDVAVVTALSLPFRFNSYWSIASVLGTDSVEIALLHAIGHKSSGISTTCTVTSLEFVLQKCNFDYMLTTVLHAVDTDRV